MVSARGFDVETLKVLGKIIGKLERFHLEEATPEEFDVEDLLADNEQAFFRIKGLANFWQKQAGADFGQHMVDLIIGAHNQYETDLTLIMLGEPGRIGLFISLGEPEVTRMILEGLFPGIILLPVETHKLANRLQNHFFVKGVITGIPSSKALAANPNGPEKFTEKNDQHTDWTSARGHQSQLERVIRGMHGATWAYVVKAHPRPRQKVIEDRMKTIDILTQVTTQSRIQWSATQQENSQLTAIESGGMTQSYSGDMVNYRAQYLTRLLERELERLEQAAAAGQWLVGTYFGASNISEMERLTSLLLGTLAGPDSRPEPLRATLCQQAGQSLSHFQSFLTSHEVATLIQFPREEFPGYAIHDHVTFDVDFETLDAMTLPLGTIQQNNRDTRDTFNISLNALAKHVVVIGVTGSGKTTTVMNLLDSVVHAKKPFLVIEPAKTEYRSLHSALPDGQHLRIYTLGNEMIAPFRLNPFEFETSDEEGNASLLTHIDFLKAIFNAAFVLYAPMPQVLEEALHEVYEDKGWDLTSGMNRRLPDWSKRHIYPVFPTLTDLYYKVEEVTRRLGYDKEIESNIQAGLKARIGSLRIGSKGLMLDTPRGIPIETLLSTPTILELEGIGNDDEKTFVMGLFLAKLYEYRRLLAATNAAAKGLSSFELQHLMVFEEAHRLLQNTSTQVSVEAANPRAQAIEVFTNMLSEMRAYGQAVLVAEQIPSKLAPDVLKNTNLKIVHRLIAQDDRQSIGQTMNLNQEQQTYLGVLQPGMAAVYAEGADHAYLVRMENYKRNLSALIDADLRQISRQYASVKPFQMIDDIHEYGVAMANTDGPDPAIYQIAGKFLDSEKSRWLWANVLLRLVANPSHLYEIMNRFAEQIEMEFSYLPANQFETIFRMIIVRGCAELLHKRGAQFGWTYPQVEELRVPFTHGLLLFTQTRSLDDEMAGLAIEEITDVIRQKISLASEYLTQFTIGYMRLMQRRQGPFAGCLHCRDKCLYRSEVKILLSRKNQQWICDELANPEYATARERYAAVATAATSITRSWVGEDPGATSDFEALGVGYCAVVHAIAEPDFTEYEQAIMSNKLKEIFFEEGKDL